MGLRDNRRFHKRRVMPIHSQTTNRRMLSLLVYVSLLALFAIHSSGARISSVFKLKSSSNSSNVHHRRRVQPGPLGLSMPVATVFNSPAIAVTVVGRADSSRRIVSEFNLPTPESSQSSSSEFHALDVPDPFSVSLSPEFFYAIALFVIILVFFGVLWYSWFTLRTRCCNMRNFRFIAARMRAKMRAYRTASAQRAERSRAEFMSNYRRLKNWFRLKRQRMQLPAGVRLSRKPLLRQALVTVSAPTSPISSNSRYTDPPSQISPSRRASSPRLAGSRSPSLGPVSPRSAGTTLGTTSPRSAGTRSPRNNDKKKHRLYSSNASSLRGSVSPSVLDSSKNMNGSSSARKLHRSASAYDLIPENLNENKQQEEKVPAVSFSSGLRSPAGKSKVPILNTASVLMKLESPPADLCQICMTSAATLSLSHKCNHRFCEDDVVQYFKFCLDTNRFPAHCPVCECAHMAQTRTPRSIAPVVVDNNSDEPARPIYEEGYITEDIVLKLVSDGILDYTVAHRFGNQQTISAMPAKKITHCPRCSSLGQLPPRISKKSPNVTCSHCDLYYCHYCAVPAHKRKSCREFQDLRGGNDAETVLLISGTSKPCPRCKVATTHYLGHACHHLTPGSGCPNCHTHWCFCCGKEWPKKAKICKCPVYCDAEGKCGCPLCPDCKDGRDCATCDKDGRCPYC